MTIANGFFCETEFDFVTKDFKTGPTDSEVGMVSDKQSMILIFADTNFMEST